MGLALKAGVFALPLMALVFAATLALPVLERVFLKRSGDAAEATLQIAAEGLRTALRRYDPLPSLISERPILITLLEDPENEGLVPFVNEQLRLTALKIGASDVYLMDISGMTVATSNYREETSFIGRSFAFRPYFTEALSGGTGRFHALGTTSGERGFFFAAPVLDGVRVLGVVAVKMTVDALEDAWRAGDSDIMVVDRNGVIFMSSRPDWHFRTVEPLSSQVRAFIARTRQYPEAAMAPLSFETRTVEDLTLSRIGAESTDYVTATEPIGEVGFEVSLLTPAGPARTSAILVLAGTGAALLVIALAATILMQRRARAMERLEEQRATRDMLERRVSERTVDLNAANVTLRREIDERRDAERRLRETQTQLIQAGKLAALGQMSAALSHEINQPLAAVKSYAENAVTFLDRDRQADARENVARISQMVDRIAGISGNLRNFARRPKEDLGPVPVAQVIDDALALMDGRLRALGVTPAFDRPDRPLWVTGGRLRLQQVIVNLLSNALDATEGQAAPRISVHVSEMPDRVQIAVRDSGPGLTDETLDQIFDPFFTTKSPGKGLGLGLSISFNIIEDFGGRLSARNRDEGGAEFTIDLIATAGPERSEELAAE